MSASLVGSEMCIRDRVTWSFNVLATGKFPGMRHDGKALDPIRQSKEPVSYTHLTLPTICSV
eukprot:8575085-Alexandrium_andersonii.AAC.1